MINSDNLGNFYESGLLSGRIRRFHSRKTIKGGHPASVRLIPGRGNPYEKQEST